MNSWRRGWESISTALLIIRKLLNLQKGVNGKNGEIGLDTAKNTAKIYPQFFA
jgi:hypothetical protein